MPDSNPLDRQAIVDAMHRHFIRDRQPARDTDGAPLYVELRSPDALSHVFDVTTQEPASSHFVINVQGEYNMAVRHAETAQDFDTYFIEELAHRLDRFAREQGLDSPCTPRDLGAG